MSGIPKEKGETASLFPLYFWGYPLALHSTLRRKSAAMELQAILTNIYNEITALYGQGQVADYIPALRRVQPRQFGMAVRTLNGEEYGVGRYQHPFSIQSISKVFTLAMGFDYVGRSLWDRVGVEPSGTPFNSLVQLESEQGIPRNPFINAGAIVISDIISDHCADIKHDFLSFVQTLAQAPHLTYDEEIARSEAETGFRNEALTNFMKSFGNIQNPVATVLDFYYHQCSLRMSCSELAKSFLFLANHGIIPATGERILTRSQAKRINAIMLTCGTYDEAGEFAFRVGIPCKSGVGGGIAAVIPGEMSVVVWGPELNDHGNSVLGLHALELFTTYTGLSVF